MTFEQDKSEHDKIKQDNNTEQMLFKQCLYHSRRGMLELDDVLGSFVKQYFYSLSTDEQYLYSQLVKREDPELYAWITGAADPEDAFKELIDKIKQSALKTV